MEHATVRLIISLSWPFAILVISLVAFYCICKLAPKMQERRLVYKELKERLKHQNPSNITPAQNTTPTEQNVTHNTNLEKYKILLDYTMAADILKWKQLNIFSILTAGIVASLFAPTPNIQLSAIVGIIISTIFLVIVFRSNAWHGYLLKETRKFAEHHTQEDNFFSPLATTPKFKWYEKIPAYKILFFIPFISLVVWILVLIYSM